MRANTTAGVLAAERVGAAESVIAGDVIAALPEALAPAKVSTREAGRAQPSTSARSSATARACARALTGGARLCAVVKADGYGHGAVPCARAALRGGAEVLAVAAASEAAEMRAALPDAPLLTMGALSPGGARRGPGGGLGAGGLARGLPRARGRTGFGARRAPAGAREVRHRDGPTGRARPRGVLALCDAVAADPGLELAALWTHFATADEDDDSFLREQLARFEEVAGVARERYPGIILHAANSAATLRNPASHYDMVRCGIASTGSTRSGGTPRTGDSSRRWSCARTWPT